MMLWCNCLWRQGKWCHKFQTTADWSPITMPKFHV